MTTVFHWRPTVFVELYYQFTCEFVKTSRRICGRRSFIWLAIITGKKWSVANALEHKKYYK